MSRDLQEGPTADELDRINLSTELDEKRENCTSTLLDFLEQPTSDKRMQHEDACSAYRDAWIRSKSL